MYISEDESQSKETEMQNANTMSKDYLHLRSIVALLGCFEAFNAFPCDFSHLSTLFEVAIEFCSAKTPKKSLSVYLSH